MGPDTSTTKRDMRGLAISPIAQGKEHTEVNEGVGLNATSIHAIAATGCDISTCVDTDK